MSFKNEATQSIYIRTFNHYRCQIYLTNILRLAWKKNTW